MTAAKHLALILACLLLTIPVPCDSAAYYGRLCIPAVDVDVALYQSSDRQAVVDMEDSACVFRMRYGRRTYLIADHYTQDFGSLIDVVVGDTAYIETDAGETIQIVCVEVLDGHNTGSGITDASKVNVVGQHDYLMYTCTGYWRNVRICQWDIVTEEAVEGEQSGEAQSLGVVQGGQPLCDGRHRQTLHACIP